jgi:hypothetical protein
MDRYQDGNAQLTVRNDQPHAAAAVGLRLGRYGRGEGTHVGFHREVACAVRAVRDGERATCNAWLPVAAVVDLERDAPPYDVQARHRGR